ncbi:hypothetical protein KP79_PYT05213 [Mizuhopecten yessoensis]|uniref:Uncharacterized protein n=1 Tax=Mizuhopecten yessoensis TaxID=6573 RepID=A0A210QCI8_MIZYE|nr:hypothetical protein KP79_PYT05213 [Mizuhopecten yessoensis]
MDTGGPMPQATNTPMHKVKTALKAIAMKVKVATVSLKIITMAVKVIVMVQMVTIVVEDSIAVETVTDQDMDLMEEEDMGGVVAAVQAKTDLISSLSVLMFRTSNNRRSRSQCLTTQ